MPSKQLFVSIHLILTSYPQSLKFDTGVILQPSCSARILLFGFIYCFFYADVRFEEPITKVSWTAARVGFHGFRICLLHIENAELLPSHSVLHQLMKYGQMEIVPQINSTCAIIIINR